MKVYTLGGFQIQLGEEIIADIANRKAEALLIYLVVTRQAHAREVLADLLWDERSQTQALANLRVVLTILRKQFGPFLEITRQSVGLASNSQIWTDIGEFERCLETAIQGKSAGAPADAASLQAAVDLYRGDFLVGFHVRDCRGFEDWLVGQREHLHQQAVGAFQELISLHTQAENFPAGLAVVNRLLQIDPLNESAHRQAMILLASSGQRGAALAHYETCQKLLEEELGVEPSIETAALYQQIRSGEIAERVSLPGQVRGYEIKEQIGVGSFGAVYRSWQPAVQREVAIKVILPPYTSDPEFIRSFEAEAQNIAHLEHPHIVPLYDFWREPEGSYLVMRWVRGGNLQSLLEKGPLEVERVRHMLEQICSGLAAAHLRGILHRDLKPANILLDEAGNAYLSDFGIARNTSKELLRVASQGPVGSPVYMSPEQLSNQPLSPQTDIYTLGVMLYEMLAGRPPFEADSLVDLIELHLHSPVPSLNLKRLDLPPEVDLVIQRAMAKEPARRYPDALALADDFTRALGGKYPAERDAKSAVGIEISNPYKGLRPFEEADEADFYGRETLTRQLLTRLAEKETFTRFLAVVGPSGSGKSSAVKAGLIPALRRGSLPGSEKWYITEMSPHTHPLDELEIALLRLSANPNLKLSEQLRRDKRGLLRAAKLALPSAHSQILLVVDQFEEVFTLVEEREEARHFMDLLYQAVSNAKSSVRVVITLRADFYDRPLMEPDFSVLVQKRTEVVVPLKREELERAIRCPAEQAGFFFEEGLVTEILAEVQGQPGTLPLLQYALTELFERRTGRILTHDAYTAIGGVLGALGQRAEAIYHGLEEHQQALARQVFLRLVALGEGVEDTRRRVLIAELESLAGLPSSTSHTSAESEGTRINHGKDDLDQVLNAFGRARLLTFDRDPLTRAPNVVVAHEALLKEWARLKTWLDESRADIRLQRLLAGSVAEWQAAGKDSSFLLRGARLAQYEEWIKSTTISLTDEEQLYLEASLAEHQRQEAEEAARQRHEAALERRSRNFLRGLVAVLTIATIIALGLSWMARRAQNQALAEAHGRATQQVIAESEAQGRATAEIVALKQRQAAMLQASAGLAAQALDELEGDQPERAVLLALEVLEKYPYTTQAESALAQTVQQVVPNRTFHFTTGAEKFRSVALSIDWMKAGKQLITVNSSEGVGSKLMLSIIDRQSGERLTYLPLGKACDVDFALSPDASRIATTPILGEECPTSVWDLQTGKQLAVLSLQGSDAANSVAWSPDSRFIAAGSQDGRMRIWKSSSGMQLLELPAHIGPILKVAWSPDGSRLLSASQDGTAKIWQVSSTANRGLQIAPEPLTLVGHTGEVSAAAWSPDDRQVVTGGADYTVRVWDARSGELRTLLTGHDELVADVAWSPDGTRIASSGENRVFIWEVPAGVKRYRFSNISHFPNIAWSPASDRLAECSWTGIRVWDLPPEAIRLAGHTANFHDAQWSPDGRWIATANHDGTVRIWEAASGAVKQILIDPSGSLSYIAWAPDSQRLSTAGYDHNIRLWDTSSGEMLRGLQSEKELFAQAWSPDGKRLAVAGMQTGIAVVFDTQTGETLNTIEEEIPCWLFIRSWSPQGDRFVTSCIIFDPLARGNYPVRVWDADTGEVLLELRKEIADPIVAVYSPDGRYIAAGYSDGMVIVWDAASGEEIVTMTGRSEIILDLSWSPNSQRLAAGYFDGYVLVWDINSGGEVYREQIWDALVNSIDWSPDGKYLLMSGENIVPELRRIWQTTEELIAYANECCVWRELTAEERSQFGLP